LVTWLQPKVYTLFSLCKLFPMQMQRWSSESEKIASIPVAVLCMCRGARWKTRFLPSMSMASTTAHCHFGCKSPSGGTSVYARGL
jgi:hypothetical protein